MAYVAPTATAAVTVSVTVSTIIVMLYSVSSVSSVSSVGAKMVGVGKMLPRAFRRRVVGFWYRLGCVEQSSFENRPRGTVRRIPVIAMG